MSAPSDPRIPIVCAMLRFMESLRRNPAVRDAMKRPESMRVAFAALMAACEIPLADDAFADAVTDAMNTRKDAR